MDGVRAEGQPSLTGATPFGKYYLLDRIGMGGMAEVFLAVAIGPEGFQRRLVIKRMLPHLSKDGSFVRMFIDEAKLCGMLSHPNLVQIFEFGEIDESFFIAMEHVDGQTLFAVRGKLMEMDRRAPVAASLDIARQVCMGLQYAHSLESGTGQSLGIVHRDISPSNIMLSYHGVVKILDFGIARLSEELRETKTQAGTMKGKLSYMSPEQVRMENVDGRSDVFAIGIVLHEMLTGRRLFKSGSDLSGAKLVLEGPIPVPSTVNPDVPPSVDPIVMRALERNVEARYQTAGEMAEDLEKALSEMRAPSDASRKLLISLFPAGPARSGSIPLPLPASGAGTGQSKVTPSGSGRRTGQSGVTDDSTRQIPTRTPQGLDVDLGELNGDPRTGAGQKRPGRTWLVLGVIGSVAIALLVGTQLSHKTPAPAVAATLPDPTAAASAPAAAAAPEVPAAPAPKPTVEISFDSVPQDATVKRDDTGEVVGRTPLTISLPQAREVVSFRVEKDGYAATVYKIIPDLSKAVRVELNAQPVAEVKPAPVTSHHTPPPAHGRAAATHGARPTSAGETAPAADGARDCLLSIASFPWADLWIDGKDTGQRTPVVHYPVSCGGHRLTLKRRDLKVERVEQVTVAPNHELKQSYEISDDYGE
jgi:serine/threonine-protein kinase